MVCYDRKIAHSTCFFLTQLMTQTSRTTQLLDLVLYLLLKRKPLKSTKMSLSIKRRKSIIFNKLNKSCSLKWQWYTFVSQAPKSTHERHLSLSPFWKAFYASQIMTIIDSTSHCKCLIYHSCPKSALWEQVCLVAPNSLYANTCLSAPAHSVELPSDNLNAFSITLACHFWKVNRGEPEKKAQACIRTFHL